MEVPFELLAEAVDQQLMFLCVSALLMASTGQLALQLLQLDLSLQKNGSLCSR